MGSGKSILLFSFLKKAMKEEGTERGKKNIVTTEKVTDSSIYEEDNQLSHDSAL